MPERTAELTKARAALGAGSRKQALRHAWAAASAAARDAHPEVLEAVIELAGALAGQTQGKAKMQAEELAVFCREALPDARAGIRERSVFGVLLARATTPRTKTCPDCAEAVKRAARVCRFCGHRFDPT